MAAVTAYQRGAVRVHVTDVGQGQAFVTAAVAEPCDAAQAASDAYAQVAAVLSDAGLQIVHERLFGTLSVHGDVR